MAYIPSSGSVVAFQSDNTKLEVGASIIGLTPVAVTNTPNVNAAGSVVAFQGTSPWTVDTGNRSVITLIQGSVAVSVTPVANQSVSGSVGIVGNPSISGDVRILGSVLANVGGSVVAFQGTGWSGSVAATVSNFPTTQNVAGSVVAFVNGTVPVNTAGSVVAFINGTVPVNAAGSVVAFQGTSPWVVNYQNSSVIAVPTGTQNVSGSVVSYPLGTIVTSLVSTIPSSVIVGSSIFGQLPAGTAVLGSVAALQGTSPWVTVGSVYQGTGWSGSVAATITNTNVNVSGSVAAFGLSFSLSSVVVVAGSIITVPTGSTIVVLQSSSILAGQTGTRVSSLVSTVPSSVIVGASIFGQLPAGTAPLGSVAVLQGTLPWAVAGSVAATVTNTNLNVSGSVVAFQGTTPWVVQSIVGTYAEDAASTDADKGLLVFGVRNDTVASLVGADKDYIVNATDSAGRSIIKPFASEDGTIISYVGSVVSGSVTLIQASAVGKKSYITDFWISNTGAATTLVTFQGGDTSLVGQFIAPTGGGLGSPGLAMPLKTNASQDLVFKSSVMTSILYLTLKGYQAP